LKTNSVKAHFRELDGIRGLLSFVILLFHLGLNPLVGRLTYGWIPEGRYELAVDFFFILSGFVLCHVSQGRKPDLGRFLVGRAFRMLPVAILSLGLCLLAVRAVGDSFTLIANLFLAQLFLGLPHLNRVAWSACSEMWMPGFLALGAWFGRKQGRALLWTLLLLMWALGGFSLGDNGIENRHVVDLLRSFAGLSAGFLLCMLFPAPAVEPEQSSQPLIPGLLLLAVILIMVLGRKFGLMVYAFPVTAGFAIVGFLRTKTFLSGRVCQFLGARSYALYMIHWPVLLFFSAYFGPDEMKGNVVLKLAIILSSLLLADLTHRYVELPCLRLRDRLMPRPARS
jgi:peptidoglycan/LPS O-acetylase OafA/YrhL